MEFGQKKFHEIDLFDFTSFFGLDFFNFSSPLCTSTGSKITRINFNYLLIDFYILGLLWAICLAATKPHRFAVPKIHHHRHPRWSTNYYQSPLQENVFQCSPMMNWIALIQWSIVKEWVIRILTVSLIKISKQVV